MNPLRTLLALLALASTCTFAAEIAPEQLAELGSTLGYGELEEEWRGDVIHLGWAPRAFLFKNLLSDEECDHLINKAKPMMSKSSVVDSSTGLSKDSEVRTSTGAFFAKGQDEIIRRIEKRVAQVTMIPVENQEGMQVLHYEHGQKYEPHNDYFHDKLNARPENGGQRIVTVLMYLTTPDEGGETVFPMAREKNTDGPEWSECAKRGMAVKAIRGDAIMFYSLKPDGELDPTSLHGSCPTLAGNKWSATKWIHVGPFGYNPVLTASRTTTDPSGCADKEEQCAEWAYFGECEKNPGFMKASCQRSCKLCGPGAKHAAHPIKAAAAGE